MKHAHPAIDRQPLPTYARLGATLLALGVAACGAPGAADPLSPDHEGAAPTTLQAVAVSSSLTAVKHAEGAYFAQVQTVGSGCPAGSLQTSVSDDGEVFTTTFSAFTADLSEAQASFTRDCQLTIGLQSPSGRSFSVQSVAYQGYAFLDAGVVGRQLVSYSFRDQTLRSAASRADLVGPYDDPFLFRDEIALDEAVWSPCATKRELIVSTSLQLQNTTPRATGSMNINAADGTRGTVQVELASHVCSGGLSVAGWRQGAWADVTR